MVRALALIGLDRMAGYFAPSALSASRRSRSRRIPQVTPADLAAMRGDRTPVVVDVRHDNEWTAGHLPAAIHIPLGHLEERGGASCRASIRWSRSVRAGGRSAIAASLLRRAGFGDVRNLVGGYEAWTAAGICRRRVSGAIFSA